MIHESIDFIFLILLITNFKDTSYTYFKIPLKYDENHDVYFMTKELCNGYLDIIHFLGITISNNENMKKMVMDKYKIENEKLPLKVSVIKDRLCPICHNSLPKKSLSNVYNLETVYIKVFYCKNCNQYYISKNDYDKNKELYLNYICLFDYLFISSQMSAKPYFIGSTGILLRLDAEPLILRYLWTHEHTSSL